MEEGLPVTTLPWCWVIETLARSQQSGAAILYELLLKAPPLSGKSGKEVSETVAFRCLEELVGPLSGSIDDHPVPYLSKDGFNASDSCEDVLQCILRENSGFDLRKDASDELKWNIRSFIELKKASLPRCSLELLKDLIVEGTHPIIESLKDIKELGVPRQRGPTSISGGVDPTSTSSTFHENGHSGQAIIAEENRDSPENRISDQPEQSRLPNRSSPQSKRGTRSDQVQEADDITHDLDDEPLIKRRKSDKQDGLQSQKQPTLPCDGNGMSSDTEDGQNHESPKASREHDGKSNGGNLGDPRQVYFHYDKQPQTRCDIDGHHPRESNDLAKKMQTLSSGGGSNVPDVSPAMNETEVNLCMKCNNGGDLINCGANTCPLAFHESCLGCSASFDDQGKFYCPFCAYSGAISEYVKAKEKVSLARRELSLFMGGRTTT